MPRKRQDAPPAPSGTSTNGHSGRQSEPQLSSHSNGRPGPAAAVPSLDAVTAQELEAQDLDWFALGWQTFGAFGLLGGAKGAGKSTVAAARMAALTGRGLKIPGQVARKKGAGLWFTAEENPSTTTRPRLKACGADLKKVRFPGRGKDGRVLHKLCLPDDFPWLEALIVKHKARYVVLDVLASFVNRKKVDLMEEQPSRWLSEELAAIAERTGCYIEGIRHCRKGTDGTQVDHFLGSGAIAAVARHVAAIKRLGGPDGLRAMVLTASNYYPQPAPALFTLKGKEHVAKPVWRGELDPDDARLQGAVEEKDSAIERATIESYVLEMLADGKEHDAKPIIEHCVKTFKVSASTVYRRATAAGVLPRLFGQREERGSRWRLAKG